MGQLDLETLEILKNAGLSTDEPRDVLAIQEPQMTEFGRLSQSDSDASSDASPNGSGSKPKEDNKDAKKRSPSEGIIIKTSTFADATLGLGSSVFYGQLVLGYESELAVGSNAAVHAAGSYLCYRAMVDDKNNGLQKSFAGVACVFTGLTSLLSVIDIVRSKRGKKLRPVTVPKVIKKLTK